MNHEDLLTRSLREVADTTRYPTTPMTTVTTRAGALRARRRLTTALAAAVAVVVVAGSSGIWLTRTSGGTSSGPTDSPSAGPGIALGSLERGPAPDIAYVRGNVYVAPDGATTRLPIRGVTDAAPYLGGFLVQRRGADNRDRLTWLDNQLRPRWTTCGNQLVPSADGTLLAFLTRACRSRSGTIHLGIPSGMSNSDHTTRVRGAVNLVGPAQGAVVYTHSNRDGVWVAEPDGTSRRVRGPLSSASAVDPTGTYVVGQNAANDLEGQLVDLATGRVVWQHPGYLMYFSPDGKYVLAQSATDTRTIEVLDATTGHDVGVVTIPTGLTVADRLGWTPDDMLLVVLRDRMGSAGPYHEAIVRYGLQGGPPQLATPVRRVSGRTTGYALAAPYF